jgi:DNA-binding SARP family transcriptional activator
MRTSMEFRILGPLEVVDQDISLRLGGAQERALLALLVLHANEIVSVDRIVEEVWGSAPPTSAAKIVQIHISQLRKALGGERIVTRAPGYLLCIEPGALDLHRFEGLVDEARRSEPKIAAGKLREALALWRGAPLADFVYAAFAQQEIARLEELRVSALEARIEAELALGHHAGLVAELEALTARHPLRERLRGHLMLALYRSGRQAEALEAYEAGRRALDESLGLEPSETLKRLQKAILVHDPSLERGLPAAESTKQSERSLIIVVQEASNLGPLLALAEPLAVSPPRELILMRVVEPAELGAASSQLGDDRDQLLGRGVRARAAAFSSPSPAHDLIRLASEEDSDLILLDAERPSPLEGISGELVEAAPCDVALLLELSGCPGDGPVIVPFGASEHDWAALELGAWFARAAEAPLQLIGAVGSATSRDASRLLADASLIVQRTAGIPAEPLLSKPGREGVTALADGAGLLVIGFSESWRQDGLGATRMKIAESPPAPTVFIRRGLRPGGLAPPETRTRFTWSLSASR